MQRQKLLLFLLLLLLSNCKDPYKLDVTRTVGRLVINGGIYDTPGPQFLKLGLTPEFNKDPDPLSGAYVSLQDENGNQESYHETGPGTYQLDGNIITGRPNGIYTLSIQLPDGRKYRSTPEKMPGTKATDSAYFKIVTETVVKPEGIPVDNTNVKIYLNSVLPSERSPSFIRWGVDEVYVIIPTCPPQALACPPFCYIYQTITKFDLKVISTNDYQKPFINDLLLQTRSVDYTFMVRHYFNVTQYTMNQNAFDYWQKVALITERTGSIFDTPPANVPGNIVNINDPTEIVYGYFEASGTKLNRVKIDRGYMPSNVEVGTCQFNFVYWPAGSPYNYCLNPYAIPGATTVMPDWFW